MKKFLSGLANVLIAVVFVFGILILISVLITRSSGVPSLFNHSFLNVVTNSMSPEYPEGTIVVVEGVSIDEIKTGDVVSFYSEDPLIEGFVNTHRVLQIKTNDSGKKELITKGDNNDDPDNYPVKGEKLIGRVERSFVGSGKIISFFSNGYAFFFLLILPMIAILLTEVYNIAKIATFGEDKKKTQGGGEAK